ncbi:MAG TPA: hypothetical protein DCE41_06810 [Cytophagales bacterium]|nr:hypothetical protein [Cytophagales bacterium]HAA19945.1 hypothetical protein [Cytophagales bacterium]HAP62628.1 hypothetical protein [Cytophagales bacterium]
MRIALILYRSPSYSETFFDALIKAWNTLGHQVVISTGWEGKMPHSGSYLPALPLSFTQFAAWRYLAFSIRKGWWLRPILRTYYRAERRSGTKRWRSIKRVYFNAHLLVSSVDWIHFGYLAAGLQREQVGHALQVPSTASIRGADISLLPLQHSYPFRPLWAQLAKVHVLSQDLHRLAIQQEIPSVLPVRQILPVFAHQLPKPRRPRNMLLDTLQLIWIGRFTWKKNPILAIQVLNDLLQSGFDVQLTMVGVGEELAELEEQVRLQGLTHAVSFVGKLEHTEVIESLHLYDILLHTAWQEGFGNVLLEAQAAGVWVVSTPGEGVFENLSDGITGTVVREWSSIALVQAVLNYRSQSEDSQKAHAQLSRNKISSKFSWEEHLNNWSDFFAL